VSGIETLALTTDTWSLFLFGYGPALEVVLAVCAIRCRFLGCLPAPVSFRNFPFQCFLQSIQHPDALFIAVSILLRKPFREVAFELCHEKVMDRFSGFPSASINPVYLVPNMPIIIFLGELSRCTVRGAPSLASQLVLLFLRPLMSQVADLNMQLAQLFIDLKIFDVQITFVAIKILRKP